MEFAIVDVETTGSSAYTNRIMDIGIVITDSKQVLNKYSTLLNPNQSIQPFVQKMTGIYQNEVLNEPLFHDVSKIVFDMLQNKIFVAHNVKFDYSFIEQSLKRSGYQYQTSKLCTLTIARKLKPELKKFNVGFLANYYGMELTKKHRALPDAEATAYIFIKLIEEFGLEKILGYLK